MYKFAERLNETLRHRQMPQSTLAKKLNVAQQVVNRYCSGKIEPSLPMFYAMCEALDESSDYLLGLTDIPR